MSATAKQSAAQMPRQADRQKFDALIRALKYRQKHGRALNESRFFRLILGQFPDIVHEILEDRDLAAAFYEDAVRWQIAHPSPPRKPDGNE